MSVCFIRVCYGDMILCYTLDFQAAIDAFQRLEKLDPYRLSSVDTYSNVLFVKVIVEVVLCGVTCHSHCVE